jgi:hypothetical protein
MRQITGGTTPVCDTGFAVLCCVVDTGNHQPTVVCQCMPLGFTCS